MTRLLDVAAGVVVALFSLGGYLGIGVASSVEPAPIVFDAASSPRTYLTGVAKVLPTAAADTAPPPADLVIPEWRDDDPWWHKRRSWIHIPGPGGAR